MLNKEKLLADADCIVVATSLGLKMQRKGRNQMILCPEHPDRHFGSCIIDHRHYHCFACHATGNAIDLAMHVQDCTYAEAMSYVAEICGGEAQYTIDESTIPEKPRPFISSDARAYLGLQDKPVYTLVGEASSFEESLQYQDEGFKVDHIEEWPNKKGPPIFEAYVVSKIACTSPLAELYYNDEDAYFALLKRKIEEKAEQLNDFYAVLFNEPNIRVGAAQIYLREMEKLSDYARRFCVDVPNGLFGIKYKAQAILDADTWLRNMGHNESAVEF